MPTAVNIVAFPFALVLGTVGLGVERAMRAPSKPETAVPVWEQRAQRQTAADAAAAGQTPTSTSTTTTSTTVPQTESNRRTRIS